MAITSWWRKLLNVALLVTVASALPAAPAGRTSELSEALPAREIPVKAMQSPVPTSEKKTAAGSPPSLDALKVPDSKVILPGEEYQKLLERIEYLKRQLKPERPALPSVCKLTGRVEGDLVYIQAHYQFKTDRPNTLINLGCQRAWPTAATLNDQLPWLQVGEDGFLIQANTPGTYDATLDLVLATKKGLKGADRGFSLDLPRAAITILERFDLPGGASDVHIGDRTAHPQALDPQHARVENVALGPLDRLVLTWKAALAEPPKGPPVLAASGRLGIHVGESQVVTDADLTLQTLQGETAVWRLLVPLPAEAIQEVSAQPQDKARVQSIDRTAEKQHTLVTVRLLEASARDLRLMVRLRQPRQGAVPVGPILVLDALTQKGQIEVHAADDLRLLYPQMRGEVSQREVGEDQRRENTRAVFSYWNLPPANPAQPAAPLLTLQVEAVKGAVQTRLLHSLLLIEADGFSPARWRLTTRIEVTPIRTAVDRLELSLPADYEYDKQVGPAPAETVEDVTTDRDSKTIQIKLAQKQFRPFALTLVGSYDLHPDQLEAVLELPRPLTWGVERAAPADRPAPATVPRVNVLDRGGQVSVALPRGLELVARQFRGKPEVPARTAWPAFLPIRPPPPAREYTWQSERAPQRVELAWRPHRPELPVDTLVDLTLAGRQARVRERLHFQFSQPAPAQVLLRVPAGLLEPIKIVAGGTPGPEQPRPQAEWAVALTGPVGREHDLTLEYAFLLPDATSSRAAPAGSRHSARRFPVPLIRAAQATRGESKVRVWSDPGHLPNVAGGRWEELPTEVVAERDSLPALVLRGGWDGTLGLDLSQPAAAPLATAVIDRVLVHATIREDGYQTYRARFLLGKLSARRLDLALPVPLASSNLQVRIANKRVTTLRVVDEAGREAVVGKVVRLEVEPDELRQPVVLDVQYELDPSRLGGNGLLHTTLFPPELPGAVLLGRTRWQVDLPPGWMPLHFSGSYTVEQQWGWLPWAGWLFLPAPRPAATSNDLEQWFAGTDRATAGADHEPALVCWQTSLAGLPLAAVPQRLWLLVCSPLLLGLGFGLLFARPSRLFFWSCLGVAGGVVALIGLLWPDVLPAVVYGSEPGALVLLVVMGVNWMLHERYRRQVVFMPGFTRVKPGSSLIRPGSSNRKREVSTVDEPPKRGSSVKPEVRG
jgi:hypothetical protein